MEEEGEKRKNHEEGNDAVSGTRKKPREAEEKTEEEAAATEDEVEEFFAILRRIHVAVSYFDKGGNGDARQLTEGGSRLMETIERECAGTVNGVKDKEREEGPEQVMGLDLDLNCVPDPEENSI